MAACGLWGSMFIWQVAKRCSNISKFTSTYQQQHGTFLAPIPLMNFNMGALTWIPFFPECVARVPISLWGSGGWGCVRSSLRLCTFATIRNRSQPFATARNRPQPSATVRASLVWPCLDKFCKLLEVSHMALLRFAWQAWHFVTFRRVW